MQRVMGNVYRGVEEEGELSVLCWFPAPESGQGEERGVGTGSELVSEK